MLIVENESSFGDRSVLACTVNVTKPEPYTTFTMCTENVTFDISEENVLTFSKDGGSIEFILTK